MLESVKQMALSQYATSSILSHVNILSATLVMGHDEYNKGQKNGVGIVMSYAFYQICLILYNF